MRSFFRYVFLAVLLVASQPAAAQHEGHHAHAPAKTTLKAEMAETMLVKGQPFTGTFTLKDAGGKDVGLDRLQEVHTQKVHALAVDESLGDYHHLHPEYKDGAYTFTFTPAAARDYKVWLDVTPVGGSQQLIEMTLDGAEPCRTPCAEKTPNDRGQFLTHKAVVSFDKPLKTGVAATGTVTLTDSAGAPVNNLEPVMGAYAHIVGFYDDFATVQHLHPLGAEPTSVDDRGASPLTFSLTPAKKGFLKYYIQLRVSGQDVFLPMGADVQ